MITENEAVAASMRHQQDANRRRAYNGDHPQNRALDALRKSHMALSGAHALAQAGRDPSRLVAQAKEAVGSVSARDYQQLPQRLLDAHEALFDRSVTALGG